RKILGRPDAVLLIDNRLSINRKVVWADYFVVVRLAAKIERAVENRHVELDVEHLLGLYQGSLLPDDDDLDAVVDARLSLETRVERVAQIGRSHRASGTQN